MSTCHYHLKVLCVEIKRLVDLVELGAWNYNEPCACPVLPPKTPFQKSSTIRVVDRDPRATPKAREKQSNLGQALPSFQKEAGPIVLGNLKGFPVSLGSLISSNLASIS